jgi:hypothetical protein
LPQCVHQLEKLINEILYSELPKNFCKKTHRIAIDLVLIPYHGNHQYRIEEVYRSQAKNGTSPNIIIQSCVCYCLYHSQRTSLYSRTDTCC